MCRHLQRHLYPYPPSGTDRGGGELPGPVCGPAVFPLRRLLQLAQSAPCAGPPDGPGTAGLLLFACLALLGLGCAMARHGGASMGAYLLGCFTWANAASLVLWQLFPLPYSWPLWFLAALLMIYLMWWGLTALLRGRLPHRLLAVLAWACWPSTWCWGRAEPPGAGSGQRAHPKRVAGRPALLPPGHLDGIAAGADRGLRPGWLWLGAAAGSLLALWERSRTEFLDLHVGTVLAAVCVMGGLCGRSGGEKPGAEEDRLPLRAGADLLYLCLSCAHLRGDEGVERHCAGLCLGHGAGAGCSPSWWRCSPHCWPLA